MTIRSSVDLEGVEPKEAFDQFVSDLSDSLKRKGIEFEAKADGQIKEGSVNIGRVINWEYPNRIEIEWNTAAKWDPKEKTQISVKIEPIPNDGTRISFENHGWGNLVGDRGSLLSEWFTDEILANLFKATAPEQFTNWLTDRRARRPAGALARETYRDPVYHKPNFKAILHYLELKKEDYLIEVGCGGGAFLQEALRSGCRAAAIDHSPDMVNVAKEVNADAISEKRLEIVKSEADSLPYPDAMFSCAASTSVFGFIDDPLKVLSEIYRVLGRGGRLVLHESSKETKGTPATPEPIASQVHFHKDEELEELAFRAGFQSARVERPDMGPYAREAGLTDELVELFSGPRVSQFLLATKK
jgi:SAM-dependent methyltransferase